MLCRGPGQRLQHRNVPEDDLYELRRVAHQLDEAKRDIAHEPVGRQTHDADNQPEQRCGDDAHGGDQQRVEDADQQRAGVRVADCPRDQPERYVEIGIIGQKAEAEVGVPSGEIARSFTGEEPDSRYHDGEQHPLCRSRTW